MTNWSKVIQLCPNEHKHLKNKDKEINEAVLGVLKEWLRGQDNPKTAYRKLCQTLRHKDVNMRSFIVETLQ